MYIITGIITILVILVILRVFMLISQHSKLNGMQDIRDKLSNALSEISNGNFSVFVEYEDNSPLQGVADTINNMAKNLGTLETMRRGFISNVSHEIQSPLTSIAGFAKLLKDDSLSQKQKNHYAEIIEAESKHLSSMSNNLLKLSRLDSKKIPINKTSFRLDKQLN